MVIKLRGENYIHSGTEWDGTGRAAIHVYDNSTVKITSEEGDGKTSGKLVAYGADGLGNFGGAAIGSEYSESDESLNKRCGRVIIAGGTIEAHGGPSAAGIGSGRDSVATNIEITGGDIWAYGGEGGAGIGAGDAVGT